MNKGFRHRAGRLSALLALVLLAGYVSRAEADAPQAGQVAASKRVEELLGAMSLEEKLGQLTQRPGGMRSDDNPEVARTKLEDLKTEIREGRVGSLLGAFGAEYINDLQRVAVEESKHGIPLIIGNDIIHGCRTTFPIPLAEAASWDVKLVERSAHIAAVEAAASGTDWTFAPMVDICRDPRWGRVAEGSGEDPYLGAQMAAARVRGFQGRDLRAPDSLLACAKHFAAYGAPEAGKDYNTVDISLATFFEVHLPPFRAAVDAGVGTLMSAFNEINGVPATANRFLMTDILRRQWGFEGFVVSDWTAVTELVAHGYARDEADAAALAIHAGVDMDMTSQAYRAHLAKAVDEARIDIRTIDEAVRRVLMGKASIGLFENPYTDTTLHDKVILCDEHRHAARESAGRSIVLLKNEGSVLPLNSSVRKIALIGPLADNQRELLGTWASIGKAEDVIAIRTALTEAVGDDVHVAYAKGCEIEGGDTSGITGAVEVAKGSDVAIVVVGETAGMSGEASCRSNIDLPGHQLELVKAIQATGKPVVVLVASGRPLAIPWVAENVPAIVQIWHPGVEAGHAVADVLFGKINPSAKLPITIPRNVGQVPIYYAHKSTGRPPTDSFFTSKYSDVPWTPLYPFGFGLSYTTFEYSDLALSQSKMKPGESITASATITNTGKVAGEEIVQLYIRDKVGSRTRPVRQLRGFKRVLLAPGESQTVEFKLTEKDLAYWDNKFGFKAEPGDFTVWIAPNSADGSSAEFELIGQQKN
ncbi:MAG: glycoside hydrolase family 3 C-terminal domain-containing protein [Phycisphaerales bacterium]|nr:glycoside hydrolase family 3 C-terminal domain-containing protein [Phycisphaerales bacterium]